MEDEKKGGLIEMSIAFSLDIIEYCEILERQKNSAMAEMLLEPAISIGRNIFATTQSEDAAENMKRLKIAVQKASLTGYWLMLCEKMQGSSFDVKLKSKLDELVLILSRTIASSRQNGKGM